MWPESWPALLSLWMVIVVLSGFLLPDRAAGEEGARAGARREGGGTASLQEGGSAGTLPEAAWGELLRGAFGPARDLYAKATEEDTVAAEGPLGEAAVLLWVYYELREDGDQRVAIEGLLDEAEGRAEARLRREGPRGEVLLLVGRTHDYRARLHAIAGEYWSGAQEGREAKGYLEQALERDRALSAAHIGIGLYTYYLALAPTYWPAGRLLGMLMEGSRERGLRHLRAAIKGEGGEAAEARFLLADILLYHERRPGEALPLYEEFRQRYPLNAIFALRCGEALRASGEWEKGARVYEEILGLPDLGDLGVLEAGRAEARLWIARARLYSGEIAAAREQLLALTAEAPARPGWLLPHAHLALAETALRGGDRAAAAVEYRAVLALPDRRGSRRAAERALEELGERP